MGTIQSYLSPEVVLTALFVGALSIGCYQYVQNDRLTGGPSHSSDPASGVDSNKRRAIRSIEKSGKAVVHTPSANPSVSTPSYKTIPGEFDVPASPLSAPDASSPKPKKSKKKKVKKSNEQSQLNQHVPASHLQRNENAEHSSPAPSPLVRSLKPTSPFQTEEPWTRVESRRREARDHPSGGDDRPPLDLAGLSSDGGITTSVTGNSSPVVERTDDEVHLHIQYSGDGRRTLAEKLLPKPSKTVVDDMLDDRSQSTPARVMRIQPLPSEKPAPGFCWGDYEDVDADGEDEGWDVVQSKRPRTKNEPTMNTSLERAPEQKTKKQRQNAKRRESQKAARVAAEAEREAALAEHKRGLDRIRMIEQAQRKSGRQVSGGMTPIVNEHGKLVWE